MNSRRSFLTGEVSRKLIGDKMEIQRSELKNTARIVTNYGVISSPYIPAFELNTERYEVALHIQSECGKIRKRSNSLFGHFSRSEILR